MKYLVLGSAGQIGNHLVSYLRTKGHDVSTFDIADDISQDLRIDSNPHLAERIRDSDFVFFLAFDVGGSKYLGKYQDTFQFLSNNTKIMEFTFSELKKWKKPFVFSSTQMSEMGWSGYGCLKRVGEYYTNSLGGLIVRFWNVYGIEKDEEKSHVITDFIKKAVATKRIEMLTDGTEYRQFLFADDCCEGLYQLSRLYDQIDKTKNYHLTSFTWTTILDVAKEIANHIPCEIVPSKNKDMVHKSLMNEPDDFILNYWQPKTNLRVGIGKMCDYYLFSTK